MATYINLMLLDMLFLSRFVHVVDGALPPLEGKRAR